MARQRLVVIGNGMAGLRFLEERRARAARFEMTVVGAEPVVAYNRVLLSACWPARPLPATCCCVRGTGTRRRHRLAHRPSGARRGIQARRVMFADGSAVPFDILVFATGSDPVTLAIPGAGLPGVVTFRDLDDVEAFERPPAGARAVVIGGGLLGIEAAYGLARRGMAVTLVHLMDRLMERQLDAEARPCWRRRSRPKACVSCWAEHPRRAWDKRGGSHRVGRRP